MFDHLNLLRPLVLMLGGMFIIWFVWMFLYFWILERRKYHR